MITKASRSLTRLILILTVFPSFFLSDGNYECRVSILSICLGLHAYIHTCTHTFRYRWILEKSNGCFRPRSMLRPMSRSLFNLDPFCMIYEINCSLKYLGWEIIKGKILCKSSIHKTISGKRKWKLLTGINNSEFCGVSGV